MLHGDTEHSETILISINPEMRDSMVITDEEQKPKDGGGGETTTVLKMQKAYRGYKTRRMLADSAVLAEEYWWQAIDFARLNHSTISFFNVPETPISRWNRVAHNASKVGKGATKDAKARKLAFQHWIEVIDARHRYGHSLHLYYEEWCKGDVGQPFFYWLDIGDGKYFNLIEFPRSQLRQQCIQYLGPEAAVVPPYIAFAVRPNPGFWEFVKISSDDLAIEGVTAGEYLKFKEMIFDEKWAKNENALEVQPIQSWLSSLSMLLPQSYHSESNGGIIIVPTDQHL